MAGHPIFAAVYERLSAAMEKAGFAELRSELLADARGRVLEIGAGTGLNLDHYTGAVTELVLTEPDPHMAKRLRLRVAAAEAPFPLEVVETAAEKIPFEDRSFDTVVATLVFCTIPNVAAAGAEIERLLRPEGRLLLLEHVRGGHEGRLTRWQDRMERPWGWFSGGCHPNRDTTAILSGRFDVSDLRRDKMPGKVPPIVRPMIVGSAKPRAAE